MPKDYEVFQPMTDLQLLNNHLKHQKSDYDSLAKKLDKAESDRDKLLVAVSCMLESAVPNERDHPEMWKAWKFANDVLDSVDK